jgi:hypothetical protein
MKTPDRRRRTSSGMTVDAVDPEFRDAFRRVPRIPMNRGALELAGLVTPAFPPTRPTAQR